MAINTKHTEDYSFGRIPPQAVDVEEAVLGALMLERDAFEAVQDILDSNSFYHDEHQKIFEAIKYLSTHKQPVDLLMVTQELKNRNQLDEVGGPFYITQLTSRVASAAHIEFHARIITQKYIQRELIRVSSEIQVKAYDATIDIDDLIDFSEKAVTSVSSSTGTTDTGTLNSVVISDACREIEADCINAQKGKISGITTGFRTLDDFIGGWKSATLAIIAARPGMGKTSEALFHAKIAAMNGKWVNFFSMEMSKTDLIKILISGQSGVSRGKIRDGRIDESDWHKINSSIAEIENLPIIWNDRAGMTISQIKNIIRKNRKNGKCDIVFVDYLQLIAPTDKKVIREQQIAEISRILKEISLNENIPVICLSQLNREAEQVEPKPSHLRESGAIEQDADIILFPWRPGYNGATAQGQPIPENEIKLIVGKNRRGRRGSFKIYANDEMTNFSEYTSAPVDSYYQPDQMIEPNKNPF